MCVARAQTKKRDEILTNKDNYMQCARHEHTKKNEMNERKKRDAQLLFFLFLKIYIQHKEPVIGDFCCRNRIDKSVGFFELLNTEKNRTDRIYEKAINAHK
jgi:hypothetical protein